MTTVVTDTTQTSRHAAGEGAHHGGAVRLDRVSKSFDGFAAVSDVSLDIEGGEFLTLLGSSGCGKTTTLRMIGGFEIPDSGAVAIDGERQNETPSYRRPVNTVFQSYALFPHMSVAENVAYGLTVRNVKRAEINLRVNEMLDRVGLNDKADQRPGNLSGGQRQRVALARALVNEPRVLLLDEPLGALDAKLRREMQLELKQIQSSLGITFVYVTHDQEEALVMSDRIAVMNAGRIQQLGTPSGIFETPQNRFVAEFVGTENFLAVGESASEGVRLAEGSLLRLPAKVATPSVVAIRPQNVRMAPAGLTGAANIVEGRLQEIVYAGTTTRLIVRLQNDEQLTAEIASRVLAARSEPLELGALVRLELPAELVLTFSESGVAE
jgi:spermidine/putrescine transport system ATP-binding protein